MEVCSLSNPPNGRVMGTRILVTSHQNEAFYCHSDVIPVGLDYGEGIVREQDKR